MTKLDINRELCKGCELCVSACRLKVLEMDKKSMNKNGFYPAFAVQQDKCVGCANCAIICPDSVISVTKL